MSTRLIFGGRGCLAAGRSPASQPAASTGRRLGFGPILLLTLCSLFGGTGPASARDRLTIAINWLPQAEYGGFYQALADGTYVRAGLDVTIRPGGAQINPSILLASGTVDLALGDSSVALNLVQRQIPIVAVAAFLQHEPDILIAHAGQGIRSPADLRGRHAYVSQLMLITAWPILARRYGLTLDQIRPYSESYTPFLVDRTSFRQGFLTYDPAAMAAAGIDIVTLRLSDYGYDPYGDVLLVRDDELPARADAIRRFIAATAAGWRRFLTGDPAAAEALIDQGNPGYTHRTFVAARAMLAGGDLVAADPATPDVADIGAMSDRRWHDFAAAMTVAGVYPADLDWHRAYRLDLLAPAGQGR